MKYIEKSQPSKDVTDNISQIRRDHKHTLDERDPKSTRKVFDCLDKSLIRKDLLKEQHGLCGYCMRRVENNENMTIDHWKPIEADVDGGLDYSNMLGTCDGGRKSGKDAPHILCCDASKGNKVITISPYNKNHMDKIQYRSDGTIYTRPYDEALERDINDILHLNGVDGHDTPTRLLWGRREAYRSYARHMEKLSEMKKLTREHIAKRIKEMESKEDYEEFAGVILYFLKKKIRQIPGR